MEIKGGGRSLLEKLAGTGWHVIPCDCNSMHWVALTKDDCIRLFCSLCYQYSAEFVLKDEMRRASMADAAKQLDSGEENDWALATQKPDENLN